VALHEFGKLLGLAQQAMGLGHHLIAERREADDAPGSLDENHAEQRFKFAKAG
jgi:hypothetical protein